MLVAFTWLAGCATNTSASRSPAFQPEAAAPDCIQGCGGSGFWEKLDDFQILQQAAGLEEGTRHEAGEELETDDARTLWEALARTGTTLRSFGPRRCLVLVLREVLARDEDVPYAEWLERLRPFRFLVVMRPDGYLVSAITGSIASSPDYFAHYSALPLQEQIREAARLSTHLLMLYGSAAGATTRLGLTGAKLPVLSLSAEGALAIEQVALPVGSTAAVLGTGAGAAYVLMKPPGDGFKSFTEDHFRENLARLTGQLPADSHAHHVFPQQFADKFQKAGLNIHDPKFGAWWERSSHLKKAAAYNERWRRFLFQKPIPTLEQILQFGRELAREYEFQVHY
jgi:hypothetical protein